MNSIPGNAPQWCEERLCQPREDLFLARLFTAAGLRPAVTASAAVYIELEAIALRFRDLNVARAKFDWWRGELARLDAGQPAHPATRSLAACEVPAATTQLHDLVTGMELNLLAGPPHDRSEAESWGERGFARLAIILAVQLGSNSPQDHGRLGTAIGIARCLLASQTETARGDIATTARAGLRGERDLLRTSPPALRVLAALAWRRATQPTSHVPTRREARRRVFTAWRAARGKLPRELRYRQVRQ